MQRESRGTLGSLGEEPLVANCKTKPFGCHRKQRRCVRLTFLSSCSQQVTFRILLGNKDIIEEMVFVFSYRSLGYEYKSTAIQAGSVYFMLLL